MPEIVEIELYRRAMAPVTGRRVASVQAPDAWYLKHGLGAGEVADAVVGEEIAELRRRGKLLLADLEPSGRVLGLRFGMTGRPIVDGSPAVSELQYAPRRTEPAWVRFAMEFEDGGCLALEDPRRLGGVELDPVEDAIGPDAFTIGEAELAAALRSRAAVKAVLLDQGRVGGLGNMIADEVLFQSGIDPVRPAGGLQDEEVARLATAIGEVLPRLLALGGSHRGELAAELRTPGARCPRDGAPLSRRTIGGRTTYSCPRHQV